jgi:histidinol phosphatase-like enzyme (inositol monophosphatase family)
MTAAPHDAPIEEFLGFAHRLADAAGAAILPHFRAVEANDKAAPGGRFDPVTPADEASEAAMRRLIEDAYPAHGVLGEEFSERVSQDGWTWILDPIDGTRAFISGIPTWGVLIALAYHGRPVIGILDQPYLEERYAGWPGGAEARLKGRTQGLRARTCASLNQATLATTDQNLFNPRERRGFDDVRSAARLTRYGLDCYAYAMVAAGHMDMVIESGLKAFDIAALIPVLHGAGGLVTDWRGGPAWSGGQVIAAGDARIHAQALDALRPSAA